MRDGTPAWEYELRMVINDIPAIQLRLKTKRGDVLITASVLAPGEKAGEDLKAILYSWEFQPDKDEPVKVPTDVQQLLDRHCGASVAHDVTQLMTNYSDGFLNSGETKGKRERFVRQIIGSVTSCEIVFTDFVPDGDRAYPAGYVIINGRKNMLLETSILKENGEWKWHGNQREVVP